MRLAPTAPRTAALGQSNRRSVKVLVRATDCGYGQRGKARVVSKWPPIAWGEQRVR
ncbi:hypothetical protein [Streptomyces flaveolus]|uniref:hypothetical protein n=1 Tax=Streptomyces flaveolus TaxID=67297 RepID=UPI0038000E5C